MFHVLLVLPAIIIFLVIVSVALFCVFAVVAGVIGGASTALLIKNETIKRLLFIGFAILSFAGFIPATPFAAMLAGLSATSATFISVVLLACVGVLAIIGMKAASALENKIAKTVLTVIFCAVLIIAVSVAVITLIIYALLSAPEASLLIEI
jgi:hypothetical protein